MGAAGSKHAASVLTCESRLHTLILLPHNVHPEAAAPLSPLRLSGTSEVWKGYDMTESLGTWWKKGAKEDESRHHPSEKRLVNYVCVGT